MKRAPQETAVLLHALGSTAKTWATLAAQLAADNRQVQAVNLRDHGETRWPGTYSLALMAEDVLDFQADVVGHSMGGRVATLLAQHHPERGRRLVIEDTLLISGGPAGHVSPDALTRLSQAIPDCRLVTIPDAGHRVHSTKPEEFWAVAGPFLRAEPSR